MAVRNPTTHILLTAALAIATTVLFGWIIAQSLYSSVSRPRPVTGPSKTVWDFTIVAMDGDKPVVLLHEWGSPVHQMVGAAASDSGSSAKARAAMRAKVNSDLNDITVVWADTGRATKPFRYYLTPADLPKANSQLDNPAEYSDTKVEVLDDDPARKTQTVRVSDYDDRDDIVNVYRVEGGRVRPLAWSRCRLETVGIEMFLIVPLIFAVSVALWWYLLRGKRPRPIVLP